MDAITQYAQPTTVKDLQELWVWLIYTTRLFQVLHGDVATFWCIIRQTQPWLGVKQWERLLLLQRKHWWRSHSSHKLAIGYIFHLQQMALTRQSPAIGKQILGTASILQQEAAEKKYSALTGVTCLISGHKAFPTFPGGPTVHHIYWPQNTDILYVQTVWTMGRPPCYISEYTTDIRHIEVRTIV